MASGSRSRFSTARRSGRPGGSPRSACPSGHTVAVSVRSIPHFVARPRTTCSAVRQEGAAALLDPSLADEPEEDAERTARRATPQARDLRVPEAVLVLHEPVGDEALLGHAQGRAGERVVVRVLVRPARALRPEDADVRRHPRRRSLEDGLDHGLLAVVDDQVLPDLVRAADVEGRLRRGEAGAREKGLVPLPVTDEERSALGIPGGGLMDQRQHDVGLEARAVGGGRELVASHLPHGLEQPLGGNDHPARAGGRGSRGREREDSAEDDAAGGRAHFEGPRRHLMTRSHGWRRPKP